MELWMLMTIIIVYGVFTLFGSYMISEGLNKDSCEKKNAKKANMGLMSIGATLAGFGAGSLAVLRILRKHDKSLNMTGINFVAIYVVVIILSILSTVLTSMIMVGMKDDSCKSNKIWAILLLSLNVVILVGVIAFLAYRIHKHKSLSKGLTRGKFDYRSRG